MACEIIIIMRLLVDWGRAARLICGAGILDEAGPYNAAFTISGVSSLLLCATVTSLRAL